MKTMKMTPIRLALIKAALENFGGRGVTTVEGISFGPSDVDLLLNFLLDVEIPEQEKKLRRRLKQ